MHRINLDEDRSQWRPLLNTVTTVNLPSRAGKALCYFRDYLFLKDDPKQLSESNGWTGG